MLAIFVAFVVGLIVGKMELFIVSRKAIGTLFVLFGLLFVAWIISNPREAGHLWQHYTFQWFGPSTTHGAGLPHATWATKP